MALTDQNKERKSTLPPGQEQRQIDSFLATARQVTPADTPLLHELAVGVFWPHRDRDLDMLLRVGRGYVAIDEIGRAMGSTMYFRTESDLSFLGMMAVAPRLQAQGTGRWLMRLVLAEIGDHDLRLTATKQGFPLYQSEGFLPVGSIRQHQGIARPIRDPDGVAGMSLRPMEAADMPTVRALDAHAYGAARGKTFDALAEKSKGLVAERAGEIRGFAMIRNFGRGKVIGPVVCEDESTAMQLVAPLIQAHQGQFLRVDTPGETPHFDAFLAAAGLGIHDTCTEMVRGRQRRAAEGAVTFGMASHSLG